VHDPAGARAGPPAAAAAGPGRDADQAPELRRLFHELGNALLGIELASAALAARAQHDPEAGDELAAIRACSAQAQQILARLRELATPPLAAPERSDAAALLRALRPALERLLAPDVRCALELPADPLWVRTPADRLEQALLRWSWQIRPHLPGGCARVRLDAARARLSLHGETSDGGRAGLEADAARALFTETLGGSVAVHFGPDGEVAIELPIA